MDNICFFYFSKGSKSFFFSFSPLTLFMYFERISKYFLHLKVNIRIMICFFLQLIKTSTNENDHNGKKKLLYDVKLKKKKKRSTTQSFSISLLATCPGSNAADVNRKEPYLNASVCRCGTHTLFL